MRIIVTALVIVFCAFAKAQSYTSYFTGNTTNVTPSIPYYGTCLMGGATENDDAMRWFLNAAGGGDVLVLRATGSDGYNDYMYNQLNVTLNSVETIVMHSPAAALDPYVLQAVANAEAIWFAGGDQWDYISYIKDTAMEDALNLHLSSKVIGGTSAGMAILGDYYFSAENGTITSAQALADPFHPNLTVGTDFLQHRAGTVLPMTLFETHFNNPDRKGRLLAFLARNPNVSALALDEYVGLTIEKSTGLDGYQTSITRVYGDYPAFQDFAYFLHAGCNTSFGSPEVLQPGQPLSWIDSQEAVVVNKIPAFDSPGGTDIGFDGWNFANSPAVPAGSTFERWWVDTGVLNTASNPTGIECPLLAVNDESLQRISAANPIGDRIELFGDLNGQLPVRLYSLEGSILFDTTVDDLFEFDVSTLATGVYLLQVDDTTLRVVKQ